MRFLVDTNVLSDARKRANSGVTTWFAAQVRADLAISVVALLELERGVQRLERRDEAAGAHLRHWLDTAIPVAFHGSILAIDERIARRAATLHVPDPMPEMDALVAATALEHRLTLVTRNTKDFHGTGIPLLNPWTA